MSAFRSAPFGAVCLFYALALGAAPANHSLPSASAAPTTVASAPLRQAVLRVLQASPEVAAAKADLEASRARALAAAQPLYNPTLSFDAENADVNRRTAGIGLTLDLSGKRRARAGQGNADAQAAQASYELLRRDLAQRWLKAWSTAALATRQSELGQHRLVLMQRFDALAAQRLKVGDISSPERDLAGLALGEAQWQQATLIGNEAASRAVLQALAGDQAIALPSLPDGLSPPAESVPPVSTEQRPELRRARAHQASAEAGERVARRARIPDPTLSLVGGEVRSGPRRDRVIGMSVEIPLPVLNSGRAEVAAARSEAAAAAAGARSTRFAMDAALQEASARYTALRTAAGAFRSGRAAAFESRTDLLDRLWRAGEISTSDYLVQLKQSLDTALSGQQLESQLWQAWFDYLTAAGRLNDWLDGRTQEISR